MRNLTLKRVANTLTLSLGLGLMMLTDAWAIDYKVRLKCTALPLGGATSVVTFLLEPVISTLGCGGSGSDSEIIELSSGNVNMTAAIVTTRAIPVGSNICAISQTFVGGIPKLFTDDCNIRNTVFNAGARLTIQQCTPTICP